MSEYFSADHTLTGTAVEVVPVSEVTRTVHLSGGNSAIQVGFTSSSLTSLWVGTSSRQTSLKLPANKSLWASSSSSVLLSVLVTEA